MGKLVATSNINHDGVECAPGDAFEVADSKQAALLIASGAAEDEAAYKARKAADAAEAKAAAKAAAKEEPAPAKAAE